MDGEVFVSYSWGGESEQIANEIIQSLRKRGLHVIWDKNDVGYKDSIKEFMQRLGKGKCIVIVICDKYLRSDNCMFELVQIAENKQFLDRIFPVVLPDAAIYEPLKRLDYIKYWEDKRHQLAEKMKTVDPANLQGLREDIDMYDCIRDRISGLATLLKDMNTLSLSVHKNTDFASLYEAIVKQILH